LIAWPASVFRCETAITQTTVFRLDRDRSQVHPDDRFEIPPPQRQAHRPPAREFGPTAKRWRPKVKAFCDFLKHRDLKRMTTADGYKWMDHLIAKKFARKSIKDVWIAALSATAGFMVERLKLDQNPFQRMKVREDKSARPAAEAQLPPRKGFTPEEA
jgi:hypothetical protein